MESFFLIAVDFFLLGVIVGSFLNVLVLRFGTGVGFAKRSFCFSCSKKLSWHELIPIVSFVIQKGRCRNCGSPISFQYPLVELLTGVLFVLIFLKLGFSFSLPYLLLTTYYLLTFSILLAIAVYDIHHKIIPNQFVYPFIAISLVGVFFPLDFDHFNLFRNWELEIRNLISGPLLAAPFALLWLVSRGKWMGLGDAKLALGIGWMLGLSKGLAALLLAFWSGALIGLLFVVLTPFSHLFGKKKGLTMKSEIPFGPFLVLGTFLAFYFDITFLDIQLFFTFI